MHNTTFTWKDDPAAGTIPAYVFYDPSPNAPPSPVALMFHAGGFVLGSTDLIPRNQIAGLVGRGFIVVIPEYRLCPQVSLFDGPIQDAKDVYRWCQFELPRLLKDVNVQADGSRIVAMGHSAGGQLALTTGLCEEPPLAIVDFYGCKQFSDPFWTRPSRPFEQIPHQPAEHISKVFEGPQAMTSLPLFIDGRPALKDPRCAWYITQLRDGTSISSIVPDGDYERVDATAHLTSKFPPTYFFHGIPDIFVDRNLTVRVHEQLRGMGVETVLDLGEGLGHIFDSSLQVTDPLFIQHVAPALDFLQRHVRAA